MVSKPFEIQPRFPLMNPAHNVHGQCVLVEAQIQNITNSILHMERVELLSPPTSSSAARRPLIEQIVARKQRNTGENKHEGDDTDCDYNDETFSSMMRPSEARQYLFRITYARSIDEEPKVCTLLTRKRIKKVLGLNIAD